MKFTSKIQKEKNLLIINTPIQMEYNNLDSSITIRISDSDIKTLKQLANKERISISGFIRQQLFKNENNE